MSKLRFQVSVSLDGFTAGPGQSRAEPLGKGGVSLHEWLFELDAWRRSHGREGGATTPSSALFEESLERTGATIMGRNMFGGGPGPWPQDPAWNGWWGDEPPFQHPVFVLTHHERAPLTLGDTTFSFVDDGIESALEQARKAAGDRDVSIGGGAETIGQYVAAGLVDEMLLNVVPVFLGGGSRLFEGVGVPPRRPELVEAIDAPGVSHLLYRFA